MISERAILYVDVEALANLPMEDAERFGDLFDDPIYSVDVSAFGATSDVDDNGKVIILFTPQRQSADRTGVRRLRRWVLFRSRPVHGGRKQQRR